MAVKCFTLITLTYMTVFFTNGIQHLEEGAPLLSLYQGIIWPLVTLSPISHKMGCKVFQTIGCDPLMGWKSFQWVTTNISNYNKMMLIMMMMMMEYDIISEYIPCNKCVATGSFDSVTYVSIGC